VKSRLCEMIINPTRSFLLKLEPHISSKLPVPSNISNLWNFGRCLGLFLALQIITGLLLARHYSADINLAFDRVIMLSRDTSWGAILRVVHLNGASMYFLFLYIHIARGLYYGSYSYSTPWLRGFSILILSIVVAFLGYVLPWGQMRYWGATVITNLISAIPIVGSDIVRWVWGGYSISNATLTRFYIIHFCTPIAIVALISVHVFFLHKRGSQNPSNIASKYTLLSFHPFFVFKDIMFFFGVFLVFEVLVFLNPYLLGDPENFSIANIISTPEHIVPEWYFLFTYAILRSIPRKGLGVIRIIISVCVILFPIIVIINKKLAIRKRKGFNLTNQITIWTFFIITIILTWLGGQIVREPFVLISQLIFIFYLLFWFALSLRA